MVRKEDLYYDSRDCIHKIHAIKWVDNEKEQKGIIQIVHGMGEYIGPVSYTHLRAHET